MKNSHLKIKPQPNFISPQLATLTEKYFSDENWIYEEKFDGIRCIAIKKGDIVTLYSRNKNKLNSKFLEIVKVFKKQKVKNFIIDGEIVAFDKNNLTSFSKLQQIKKEKIKTYFYAFDLPYFDRYDLKDQKLIDRKKILKKNFKFSDRFRYTPHIEKEGIKLLKQACKKGWEGIIAKKADSKYQSKRTKNWLKFKCSKRQEFIIIGYTDPQKSRIGFGSLLVGYFDENVLKYAGKVGTGYSDQFLKDFSKKLKAIETKKEYFFKKIKNAHFVKLKYVAEIGFTEITNDKKLRHPRFIGLREDKSPKSVVLENPR
ncbi:MAG: non-homologous end-joining DNA ligase [Parachlamydiales bacterium]|nr:non-homologous end-joining DNA ligase [Parachlamydiales bacterium]